MSDPDSIAIFSAPQIANIRDLLHERWGARLGDDEDFKLSGAVVGDHVTVGLLVSGGNAQYLSEASMNHAREGVDLESAALLLLDLLEGYFADYLDAERISQAPLDWSDLEFQGHAVQVRADASRPGLDAQADALLSEDD